MSRSCCGVLRAALGSVLGGVGSWCARRKRGLRTASAGLLIASVAACTPDAGIDSSPDPDPDPDPGPSAICVDDTAVDYANEVGLELDVSIYDSNDDRGVEGSGGCFNADERDWMDALNTVEDEGLVSVDTGASLDEFVDAFPVVDDLVVNGFSETYRNWLIDREFDPDLEFTPRTVGWIPLDMMVPDLILPGTFHAEGDFGPLSPYPINERVSSSPLPDWDARTGVTSTYLSEFGICAECDDTEDQAVSSSLDISIHRDLIDFENGRYEILWYEVNNGTLREGTIEDVTLRQELEEIPGSVPHTSLDVEVSMPISADSRYLFGGVEEVTFIYNHVVAWQEPRIIDSISELPEHLQPGTSIGPGDSIGWVDPYRTSFVFDLGLMVAKDAEFPDAGPATHPSATRVVLDPAAANYAYADGSDPRYTQPRLQQNWTWGPFLDDDGGLIPGPSEPYTPSVSTTGERFVYVQAP